MNSSNAGETQNQKHRNTEPDGRTVETQNQTEELSKHRTRKKNITNTGADKWTVETQDQTEEE